MMVLPSPARYLILCLALVLPPQRQAFALSRRQQEQRLLKSSPRLSPLLSLQFQRASQTPSCTFRTKPPQRRQQFIELNLCPSLSSSTPTTTAIKTLLILRGGGGSSASVSDVEAFVSLAYDWCFNLGAPAALIAGAVIATLYDSLRGGALEVYKNDSAYVQFAKKGTKVLLLSAFGLQIISIFVTTVTGTMLISHDWTMTVTKATTALGFLREHLEFEYLTARITFLQGLLNWLAGVALEHTIPRRRQGRAAREMDQFVACSLGTLLVVLLSFYNAHLTFYHNYLHMILRWYSVFIKRFFRLRPLAILYGPLLVLSVWTGIRAMWNEKEGNLEEVVVLGQTPPTTNSSSSNNNNNNSDASATKSPVKSPVGDTTK